MTHAIPEYTLEQLEAAGRIELDHFTSEDAFELGTLAAAVTPQQLQAAVSSASISARCAKACR